MRFRPCIDIHNGKVKQIVGGSLRDEGNSACTNFSSELGADFYAGLYRKDGLRGGHIILLNPAGSDYYEMTRRQALSALSVFPGGMQIGGGITAENAVGYLEAGASHVIVTSYVFLDGEVRLDRMERLKNTVGRERVVIDLSCRKKDGDYYIVTNRWQTFTQVRLTREIMDEIADYCDEFLVHGVDVEGQAAGVDEELARLLSAHKKRRVTYAGGIGSPEDLMRFEKLTEGKVDFTIGSALDLFGGAIPYQEVKKYR